MAVGQEIRLLREWLRYEARLKPPDPVAGLDDVSPVVTGDNVPTFEATFARVLRELAAPPTEGEHVGPGPDGTILHGDTDT